MTDGVWIIWDNAKFSFTTIILMRKSNEETSNIKFRLKHNSTYRSRAERLIHVIDIVIDVIVVKVIAGGVAGGVVVACVMIRMVPIVVLVVFVQHHRGEHVECLPRTVSTRNEQDGLSKMRRSHYSSFRHMTRVVHFNWLS